MVELHLFGVEVVQASSIHLSGGAICRHDSRCVPGAGQEGRNMNILPSNKPTSSQSSQHTVQSLGRSWTRLTAGVSAFGHSPSAYLSSGRGCRSILKQLARRSHILSHRVAAVNSERWNIKRVNFGAQLAWCRSIWGQQGVVLVKCSSSGTEWHYLVQL